MSQTAAILIVDDDPSIRFVLGEVLTRDGYQVLSAESGEAALDLLQEGKTFDLALVDIQLHGMTGLQFIRRVREQYADMAIIVLTAHASLESAVEALRSGAADYLFKPCQPNDLRNSVARALSDRLKKRHQRSLIDQMEQIIDRYRSGEVEAPTTTPTPPSAQATPPNAAPGTIHHKGLVIDNRRHVVILDNVQIDLSPTEFGLLAYLTREAPRVVSAEELVREVQGYSPEDWDASEALRFHIYRIRQKIRAATGRTDLIRTARGVGYALE